MKKFLSMFIMMFVLAACSGETMSEDDTNATDENSSVKIGTLSPLTGDLAWLGESINTSAKLAAKELSDENYQFEIVIEDDSCEPKSAVNAYNKLKSENVTAVIGPACSAAMLAVAPLAERDQVILVTPGATNPDISEAGDFIFRTIPSDALAGKVAAEFMYNDLGYTKVGINGKNDAWGQGLTEVFSARFTELGGEITTTEKHEGNATDLKTQLTKIKNSGAEAIYAPTFQNELIVMAKQMEELDMADYQVLGGDAVSDVSVAEALIDSSVNVIFTFPKENKDQFASEFKAAYEAEYGEEAGAFTPETYDAAYILMQAIKTVGTDTAEVRDYLYSVEGYNGASGTITFDENGDSVAKEIGLFTYSEGTIVEYTQ